MTTMYRLTTNQNFRDVTYVHTGSCACYEYGKGWLITSVVCSIVSVGSIIAAIAGACICGFSQMEKEKMYVVPIAASGGVVGVVTALFALLTGIWAYQKSKEDRLLHSYEYLQPLEGKYRRVDPENPNYPLEVSVELVTQMVVTKDKKVKVGQQEDLLEKGNMKIQKMRHTLTALGYPHQDPNYSKLQATSRKLFIQGVPDYPEDPNRPMRIAEFYFQSDAHPPTLRIGFRNADPRGAYEFQKVQ